MKTRYQGRFQSGYYRNLSKTVFLDSSTRKDRRKDRHRSAKRLKEEANVVQNRRHDLLDQLNFEIVCLLQKNSGSPYCSGRIQCKQQAITNITNRYSLNKRFKNCDSFLRDFNIICIAFCNSNFFKIKENTFRIKIYVKKKRMVDQNLSICSPYVYMCFDFIKMKE